LVAIKYGGTVSVRYKIIPELEPHTHLHAKASYMYFMSHLCIKQAV
jgi:hypothetical protein